MLKVCRLWSPNAAAAVCLVVGLRPRNISVIRIGLIPPTTGQVITVSPIYQTIAVFSPFLCSSTALVLPETELRPTADPSSKLFPRLTPRTTQSYTWSYIASIPFLDRRLMPGTTLVSSFTTPSPHTRHPSGRRSAHI